MIKPVIYTAALLLGFLVNAPAQTISDLNKRLKRAEEEIAYIDKLLQETSSDRKNNSQRLGLTQKKIKSRRQIIADMDAQIHILENNLGKKQEDINGLGNDLHSLKQSYAELLYHAYKHRNKKHWMLYILSSDDIGLAYRRWRYLKNYSKYINEQAGKIQQTSEKITTEIVSMNTQKETLARQKNAREKEVTTLRREESEALKLANNITAQEKDLTRRLNDQRRAVERINRQIEKIIAEQAKKDRQRRKDTPHLPQADKALSESFAGNRGQLPWPVRKGIITKKFGQHYDPVFKNLKLPHNNGIDITTDENSTALCIFDGVVRQIFLIPGMNNCVMVQHGEYYTLYCKLSAVKVKVGDRLTTGHSIGTIYSTDETVLHFEIWKAQDSGNPEKLNPELWLKK